MLSHAFLLRGFKGLPLLRGIMHPAKENVT
jgi:hypothetical protein